MGHGFDCGEGSCIDWYQRHVRVFSALILLSSLRGIRSCGGHHGLGSRLGLVCLLFRFLLLGFD